MWVFEFLPSNKLYRKSVVIDFKRCILLMVQLQGRRNRLCVFVICACWLAFREAKIKHRVHVCTFVQKMLSLSKISFYVVFAL